MPEEIPLSSAVELVEVYRVSALVTRRVWASVAGRTGRLSCTLGGLPLALHSHVRADNGRFRLHLLQDEFVRDVKVLGPDA